MYPLCYLSDNYTDISVKQIHKYPEDNDINHNNKCLTIINYYNISYLNHIVDKTILISILSRTLVGISIVKPVNKV